MYTTTTLIMRTSSLELAKNQICEYFDDLNQGAFRRSDIYKIFAEQKDNWKIVKSTKEHKFIKFLMEETKLTEHKLKFPSRNEILFVWGNYNLYEMGIRLRKNSFLSHLTAAQFHELTTSDHQNIYINQELKPYKSSRSKLEQNSIDNAFKNNPRMSNNFCEFKDKRLYLLFCKHINSMGIITIEDVTKGEVQLTDLERTLIDIAVRPFYTNGIQTVLNAYKAASEKVNIEKLIGYLSHMDYVYPYHQSIGFYLDKSGGYPESSLRKFEELGLKYNFYLTNKIQDPQYSSRWKVYYPSNLAPN